MGKGSVSWIFLCYPFDGGVGVLEELEAARKLLPRCSTARARPRFDLIMSIRSIRVSIPGQRSFGNSQRIPRGGRDRRNGG